MRRVVLIFTLLTAMSIGTGRLAAAGAPATAPAATTRPAATRPAKPKLTAAQARKLYWTGKYDQAVQAYRKLLSGPGEALTASIGLAEVHTLTGRYEEALTALDATARRGRPSADWHIVRAEALAELGRYEDALAAAQRAFDLRPDWAPAILCAGEALETLGKKTEAIAAYKAVENAIARKGFRSDARSLVAGGHILDRYAILTGQKASEQAQNILHNYFQQAHQKIDKQYWPANVAAGMLLLAKHKTGEAGKEFALAAKINKRIPDVLVAAGAVQLSRYQFEKAIAQADKALKINPQHADALLVRAAAKFRWRKLDEVAPELDKILKFNPNHLQALSMMASLHVRRRDEDKAQSFIRRIQAINPAYAQLHEDIGDWLSSARQYAQAEKHYKKAMEMAPELAGPVTSLGKLYMQTGQEKLAEETLKKAFAIDDFRADVRNYLQLVRKLNNPEIYKTKETEHFIIKVDPTHDEVLLAWVAREAERIHAEVSDHFDHVPPVKTLVELFPDHSSFAVRISGRGRLHTVGACTGRVIAMPAPDPKRGGAGTFNWAVVLRHEYTHAVTLSATANRIPHWFTEACAVWEQPDRQSFRAVQLLLTAVRADKLFPVKELSWGFIRPSRSRGPNARSLAYAQSEWIFEYIVEKKGYDAIPALLAGFRAGKSQSELFQTVVGTTEEQFDKDFRAWARQQVVSWGFDPMPRPSLAEANKRVKAEPLSPDAHAELAAALLRGRKATLAIAEAKKALRFSPAHKQALEVIAYALSKTKKHDDAIKWARQLEQVDPYSAIGARVRAESHLAKRRWADAIVALEAYKQRRPVDSYGYERLAKLYMQIGRTAKALPNLIELHRRTVKDPKYARQIADIYRTSGKPDEALVYYERVIQINPYDAGAYQSMAGQFAKNKDYDGAILAMRSACMVEPKNADFWVQLAAAHYRSARASKSPEHLSQARSAAQKAHEIDPNSRAADILQMIEEAAGEAAPPSGRP